MGDAGKKCVMSIINFVGQFLKSKGYENTLRQLELEYGKPIDSTVENLPHGETLEEILHDRINFKSIKTIEDHNFSHWKSPFPNKLHHEINVEETIVSVAVLTGHLLISTAKQKLILMTLDGEIMQVYHKIIGVVVKKIITDGEKVVFFGGMDGKIHKFELENHELVKKGDIQIHRRLIVDMKYINGFIISVGFEKLVKLITKDLEILASVDTMNAPVCIDGIAYNNQIYAAIGYTDNTLIDIFKLSHHGERLYKISTSDAEFATSSFTPRSIQFKVNNNNDVKLAIGTNHEPYMRLIVLSIDDFKPVSDDHSVIKRNKILKNIVTMSPQDKYSNPFITWRVDNDGVWVGGDDGKIRGIDLFNDEIFEITGHDGRVKWVQCCGDSLVTVGDDKMIKIWR